MNSQILLILSVSLVLSDLYIYFLYYKPRVKNIIGRILFFLPTIILLAGVLILYNESANVNLLHKKYMMYFLLTLFFFLLPKLIFMAFSLIDQLIRLIFRAKKFRFFTYFGILAAIASLFVLIKGTWIDRDKLEVRQITLISDSVPMDFCGFRILQISDLHLGNLVDKEKMITKIVKAIKEEKPDLIVITGDVVEQYAEEMDGLESIFAAMKAPKGIISILGNRESGDHAAWNSEEDKAENFKRIIKKQNELGWIVLKDESMILYNGNDSVAIIGVENRGIPLSPAIPYGDLETAIKSAEHVPFKILLTHNPNQWGKEVAGKKDIFLTLSGHTHAMQFVLTLSGMSYSPASLRYNNWRGLYTDNDQHLYVNAGIGYTKIPFRFGVRPEISIIELNRKAKKEQPVNTAEITDEETVSN